MVRGSQRAKHKLITELTCSTLHNIATFVIAIISSRISSHNIGFVPDKHRLTTYWYDILIHYAAQLAGRQTCAVDDDVCLSLGMMGISGIGDMLENTTLKFNPVSQTL